MVGLDQLIDLLLELLDVLALAVKLDFLRVDAALLLHDEAFFVLLLLGESLLAFSLFIYLLLQ